MAQPSDFITSDPANTQPAADPLTGEMQDTGLTFTPEQAALLNFADAEPGAYFTVKIRISDNSESGVKAEPLSAEPSQDEMEMAGDPDASMESEEPKAMPPRPKPSFKGPKSFGMGKAADPEL